MRLDSGIRCALLLALFAGCPVAAQATGQPANRSDIARVEAYLNALRSLRSEFVQRSSGGRFAEGTIYAMRPGRLRLDYNPPSTVQFYANGGWLLHVDTALESVSRIPLSSTPARFLTEDRISLSQDTVVRRVDRSPGAILLELAEREDPEAGSIAMRFSTEPMTLRGWTVIDAEGTVTSVTLTEPAFNVPIPRRVFIFDARTFEGEPDFGD